MVYRRTANVERRLAARNDAIFAAARSLAAEGGMAAVQIAPVAERAGIAAGTIYRYVPSKTDLVATLVKAMTEREIGAMRRAANAAPGPLSAIAAAIVTFAARALVRRRLTWALLAEPVDAEVDAIRQSYRKALVAEIEARLKAALASGKLPEQDVALTAPALVGGLVEGLLGPLAPDCGEDQAKAREVIQALTLMALRAAGVFDAHARGLVVQTILPRADEVM